jgi:serine/threonine-protein kinase
MATPSPDDDVYAGQRFGSYVLHECVGRGGMARVYRAEHMGLEKVVALKLMERERVHDPKWRARFVREAKSAAVVKHPHIVDVTDVGVEGDVPFLVMEYLVGSDLSAHLAEVGALGEETMADLLLPIVAGLAFAHDAGVIHRDIKPSNIFLARSPDGTLVPKLLDFGIAKSSVGFEERSLETDTNQIIGTPMFMAPEALDGARHLTGRSDQYSLGLVMYQCLTGRAPFDDQTPSSLLRAVATARLRPLRSLRPGISRALERLVGRMLELDPEQRFEHVRDIGARLLPLASPRSRVLWDSSFGVAASGVPARRLRGGARRSRALVAFALFAVALAVGVAVVQRQRVVSVSVPPVVVLPPPAASSPPSSIQAEVVSVRPVPSEPASAPGATTPGTGATVPARAARARARPSAAAPATRTAAATNQSEPAAPRPTAPSAAERSELRELFPGIGKPLPAAQPARSASGGASIPE